MLTLGFGKTETDFEQQECDFVEQFIKNKSVAFTGSKYDFNFSGELVTELKSKLKERQEHYDKLSEQYETATDYPERYTTYDFNILTDKFRDLCVIFRFSHINRKHPISPDGWALLETKRVYHADIWDFRR
jgi:hypothetical protein